MPTETPDQLDHGLDLEQAIPCETGGDHPAAWRCVFTCDCMRLSYFYCEWHRRELIAAIDATGTSCVSCGKHYLGCPYCRAETDMDWTPL